MLKVINKGGKMDLGLFIAVLMLLGIGIVLVYSSSFAVAYKNFGGADYFLSRQVTRAFLAVIFFMIFINIDYHIWSKYSGIIFAIAAILLIYILLLPDTHAVKGAKRWVTFMGIRFQVSDFARMALVLFLSKKCSEDGMDFSNWRTLIQHYVCICILCGLIVLEPDFSTTMIIAITAAAMLFMAGARVHHLLATVALAIPFVIIMILRMPYRMRRVTGFLNLEEESGNLGYQVYQSLVGLGHGGLFGVGLGRGEQKYFYLPEPHTDFIFSILGEEFGFVGIMIVMLIFAFIVYRGFSISLNAPDRTGQLIAFGFTFATAMYLLIHSSVATGLVPPTGITMPFLSYGGMSLIFTMSSMGILLNISSQANAEKSATVRLPAMSSGKRKKI